MTLYKLTNGLGDYWVIAETATEAEAKLDEVLSAGHGYGFSSKRVVKNFSVIATEITKNGSAIGGYHLTDNFLLT